MEIQLRNLKRTGPVLAADYKVRAGTVLEQEGPDKPGNPPPISSREDAYSFVTFEVVGAYIGIHAKSEPLEQLQEFNLAILQSLPITIPGQLTASYSSNRRSSRQ